MIVLLQPLCEVRHKKRTNKQEKELEISLHLCNYIKKDPRKIFGLSTRRKIQILQRIKYRMPLIKSGEKANKQKASELLVVKGQMSLSLSFDYHTVESPISPNKPFGTTEVSAVENSGQPGESLRRLRRSSFLPLPDDRSPPSDSPLLSVSCSTSRPSVEPSWILRTTATRRCRRPPPTSTPATPGPRKQRMMGRCPATPSGCGSPCWPPLATLWWWRWFVSVPSDTMWRQKHGHCSLVEEPGNLFSL